MTDLATLALSEIGQFLCSEHGTLADAACAYLQRLKEPPRFGAIAVAGHKRCDQPYQFDLVLVIKTLDAGPHAGVLKPLKAAIGGDERIHLIEGTVSCAEMNGLLATADAFVSLHRSEGFGFGLADALLLGKPVIGTDYSGNTDFLNANTGYPVPYELVPVGAGEYPDHEGQVWAEPDIGVAARHMASIVDDPAIAEARALAGHAFIKTHHSLCGRRQIDARPAGLAWPARRARNLNLMAKRHSTRKRCPLRGIDFEKMKSTSLAWNRAMSRDCASLRCPSMA